MKLSDYFEPVDFSRFKSDQRTWGKFSLGAAVEKTGSLLSGNLLSEIDIAIVGVPFEEADSPPKGMSLPDRIRQNLYPLAAIEKNLKIADLGNLKPATTRKGLFLALRDIIECLREADVIAVVIGTKQEFTLGICEAFNNHRFFWLTAIDAVLDVKRGNEKFDSANYLTRIFRNMPGLFHFSLIGYQQHLVNEKLMNKTVGINEHLRLGQLRENFTQAEVLLRSTDVLTFDMGAVRFCDAPSTSQKNPNGLQGEEACHLARYAGLSPELGVFGLFEAGMEDNRNNQTSRLAAEIIWYFLEGAAHRKPIPDRTVYKVEIEGLEHPLIFLQEKESNRWWFQVQSLSGICTDVACSEEEYRLAAANEIPERWLKFIQKMDRLLK
jgi:formiminoglutamase